jgi:hypothetical protein
MTEIAPTLQRCPVCGSDASYHREVEENEYGNEEFNECTRAFKDNPSIENYVSLRRKHPNETIEVAITGGLDWLFGNKEFFRKLGITQELAAAVLDADCAAISELSLVILEHIIERDKQKRAGATHLASRGLAISDSTINYAINIMLNALDWNNTLHIPRDLIVLIQHQIGSVESEYEADEKRREFREAAILAALTLLCEGKEPSYPT